VLPSLTRRTVAEALGVAFLLAAIVGSGIMASRLTNDNAALTLLVNTLATGAALLALILALGPISGGHFNPAVTLAEAFQSRLPWREVPSYIAAQVAGAIVGVLAANAMFGLPAVTISQRARNGPEQLLSEFIATFGLVAVIALCVSARPAATAYAVAAYITSAYWFTASTSFANPAVTIARSLSNTFAGIRPADTPGFIVAELLGAAAATLLALWLIPQPRKEPVL
jgi:glycerol uptake facilitator-like aquaporin